MSARSALWPSYTPARSRTRSAMTRSRFSAAAVTSSRTLPNVATAINASLRSTRAHRRSSALSSRARSSVLRQCTEKEQTMTTEQTDARSLAAWKAVATLYHAYFTGIVLYTVSRLGTAKAEELVYEVFSHQRRERFLPGLDKLGLSKLPDAVAAAQYHYLSNHIGGVAVEYMYESDRKAWIRYAAPRWIWSGTALCGIPPEVSRAMLAGWHAQNGVMLKNPRMGFVCTKQTVDGQSGLEGYYYEYDHDLLPHERLRFARDEDAPDFDPAKAPKLPTDEWPEAR